ncbi:MAG TPA: DUF418 domain-containing protein [Chitinophagaceae bacterium]|nr:DUF418 domain-containing protein [Chitinophagaceae bacterium]
MSSAPVQPSQRIQYLDVIRGFAITGVLFAYVFWNLGNEPSTAYSVFDNIVNQAGYFLVDSKCYTILATLFSLGFVLHMHKTNDKARSLYTYRKRLLGLFILGTLHAVVLRNGDILAPYAITAFIMTFLYQSSKSTIIFCMIILFLMSALMPQAWHSIGLSFPQRPAAQTNYWVENFAWLKYWYKTSIFFWETTLFLLLAGLLIGRVFIQKKKILSNGKITFIGISGLVAGVFSYLVMTFYKQEIASLPDIGNTVIVRSTFYNLLDIMHKIGMASSYACILYFLSQKFKLAVLANLGRMSLTNYVLQAAVVVPVCLLFNLFDHITPTIALVMTVAIWIMQVALSQWWLKQYRFGPLEWLLRKFTYGKAIVVKKQEEPPAWATAPVIAQK